MTTPEQQALQLAAQAWCEPATSGLEMDVNLATAVAEKFAPIIAENAALKAELEAIKQGAGEPYCYVYEWDTEFGLIQNTRPANFNGKQFDRVVPVYTRPCVPLTDEPELLEALKRLLFAAQTTGGVAGRDEGLCAAIDAATAVIAKVVAHTKGAKG